MSYMLKPLW